MTHGIGPILARRLIQAVGSIEQLWSASARQLQQIDGIGPQLLHALASSKPQQVNAVLEQCRTLHIGILCPDDPLWPAALSSLDDAPLVLFYYGRPEALSRLPTLAIVGARRASSEGRLLTRRWSCHFAEHQLAIVSGMAFGIDAAAHGGALDADGITIAVLGCGLHALSEQQQAQVTAISRRGCVLSEFMPDQQARPEHFPRRNRIIAGISRGTLVMQADIRSGSLITARLAADYGRDVLAVPGSVSGSLHSGCHQLIRDGALLLDDPDQLLRLWHCHALDSSLHTGGKSYVPASPMERSILAVMRENPAHIDLLAETCGLTLPEISPIVLRLELQGVIQRLPGSRYLLVMELSEK